MCRPSVPLALALVLLGGCDSAGAPAPEVAPAGGAASLGQQDLGAAASGPVGPVRGKVSERLDAGSYTYLRLETIAGRVWAAVPRTDVAVGTEVAVENPMVMDGFESKTLGRVFERIVFGTLPGQGAPEHAEPGAEPALAHAGPGAAPMPPPHAAGVVAAPVEQIRVEKAEGGLLVAEVIGRKAALKEKKVSVRGKVVKYSGGILGKNWLHLRDGSGSPEVGDHDITVTTGDLAEVGEIVLIRGVVRLDKDFGAGYAYPVLIEEATITR